MRGSISSGLHKRSESLTQPFHWIMVLSSRVGLFSISKMVSKQKLKKVILLVGYMIQRGTIHAWENSTDEYARMYFVLLGVEPFFVDGKPLGDAGYEKAH